MLSFGMFSFFAARIAVRRRGLEFGSPPPMRAAMVISRMIRVKARPRFASVAAFLCLIVAHFECPDMTHPRLLRVTAAHRDHRYKNFCAAERLRTMPADSRSMPKGAAAKHHANQRAAARKPTPVRTLTGNATPPGPAVVYHTRPRQETVYTSRRGISLNPPASRMAAAHRAKKVGARHA